MSLLRLVLTAAALLAWALPASADRSAQLEALLEAMRIADTVAVMQEEGHVHGADLARDMIPHVDTAAWDKVIDHIYDGDKMYRVLADSFAAELAETDLGPLLDYYQTDEAAEIVALELSARHAFLDRATEEFAAEQFHQLAESGSDLVEQVNIIIDDSDLVELNVTGALNSDLMFYNGLNDGGAFNLSEQEILADVWSGEEELRVSSREWLQSFLLMAYRPVEMDDLRDYAAFWRTDEGRDLNRALFVAFDRMYEDLSYLLGLAIAEQMQIEEL